MNDLLKFFGVAAVGTMAGLLTSTPWLFWVSAYFLIFACIVSVVASNDYKSYEPVSNKDWFDELADKLD